MKIYLDCEQTKDHATIFLEFEYDDKNSTEYICQCIYNRLYEEIERIKKEKV